MYTQRIAYVDLSTGRTDSRPIPETLRERFLGGRGIAMHLLYHHAPPRCDPLGPENPFIVSAGLLGGTIAPSSGRCDLAAKSPLTGLLGNSNMGGFFAPELRYAGFDHLVITGRAEKPVYLWVHDGRIELRDAAHIWGKDTLETAAAIRKELGDEEIKVMAIGPAGEQLVRFAAVITGLKNAAGRTGMGCVMGSKNLKGIAARGTGDLAIARPKEAFEHLEQFLAMIRRNLIFQGMSVQGTALFHESTNLMGRLRIRNLQSNQDPEGFGLYANRLEPFAIGKAACFGCPVHCRHQYIIPEGPRKGARMEGPEWSTIGGLGSELGIREMAAVLAANDLVNRYGMDSLETGSMIAWAIELYEKGLIGKEHTGGLEPAWGSAEVLYRMIEMIGRRERLGDILAEGPLRAIEKLGEPTRFYNLHVKGMSCLHTDERATPAMALGIAVASRGADHLRNRPGVDAATLPPDVAAKAFGFPIPRDLHTYEGSGRLIWWHDLLYALTDALGVCKFQAFFMAPSTIGYEHYGGLVGAIAGLDLSGRDLMEAAERICTIERLFNLREGLTRRDDFPPERYFTDPTPPLGLAGFRGKKLDREPFERELNAYYQAHGWDRNGVPTPETLRRLGLDREWPRTAQAPGE